MKQKRKVKSLITQKKDWGESVLTTLLLILGVILCLGSASLMTMSVGAASTSNGFDYKSTVDDKTEVLYKLQFSKSGSLSTVVSEMFTDKNDDFYISGGLIVNGKNGNKIGNVKSNILGGSDNEVYSNNITIIGGNENKVAESNDNAIILGGDGNTMSGSSSGNPSIMVGGSSNTISKGHDNDGIIGGSNNTIGKNVSNSFIIGGNNNTVNASNVIVGGSNVEVGANTGNVFVFSTTNYGYGSKFKPQTPNAFYINVKNGLGINTQSVGQGITVNGPVRFGEININNTSCNEGNIGVIGSWDGCLVGCTKDGLPNKNLGKWTLFDLGDKCQKLCETYSGYCLNEVSKIDDPTPYNSFCTDGVNTGHAKACTPDVLNQIQNVVFETTLIDSTVACPANPANKCIYKCDPGYYLKQDKTNSYKLDEKDRGNYACYADCDLSKLLGLEWMDNGNPIILKHNDIVTGYNASTVQCANDNPDDGGGTRGDPLPEHCGNNDHKRPLVCVNGNMEIANGYNDPRSTNTNAKEAGYFHRSCSTSPYVCNGKYDLTASYIENTLLERPVANRVRKDRGTFKATRGTYKLCLDYKVESPNNIAPGNEKCTPVKEGENPYTEHYMLVECNEGDGYYPTTRSEDSHICRKSCSLSIRDIYNRSKTTSVKDDSTITLYDAISAECKKGQHCNSKKYYCDDGILKNDDNHNQNATDRDKYNYENCETIGNNCEGYDVDSYIYENYKDVSIYLGPCQKYQPYQNSQERWGWITSCNYEGSWYMLTGCVPGYHAVGSTGWNCESNPGKYCIEDKITEECDVHHTKPENSEWMDGSKVYIRNLVSKTQGKERWKCANDEAGVNCQWYCIGGYVMNAAQTGCEYNPGPTLKDPVCLDQHFGCNPGKQIETGEILGENIYGEANIGVGWKWKCENDGTISNLCIECNPFYHENLAGTGCEHYKCLGDINGFQNAERVNNYSRPENGDAPLHFEDRPDYDPTNACKIKCKDGYYKVEENGFISCELIPNDSLLVRFDLKGGNFENPGQENPMIVDMGTEITIPSAIKGCDEFKGWQIDGRGNHYKLGDKYIVNLSTTFVADWNNKECPESLCIGGDEPAPKTTNDHIERGGTPPTNGGSVPWVYNDETGDLNPCEWRCETGYIRKGNKCVEKQCGNKNFPSPTTNVITGSSTYTGDDKDGWTYTDNKNPGACQWTCEAGYIKDPDANKCIEKKCATPIPEGDGIRTGHSTYTGAYKDDKQPWNYTGNKNPGACEWTCLTNYEKVGNGCVRTVKAKCTSPAIHFQCDQSGDSSGARATHQHTGLYQGVITGWSWTCEGTPNGENSNCIECNTAAGYEQIGTDCVKNESYECTGGDYPLPDDAKQHPEKYEYNGILDNFDPSEPLDRYYLDNKDPIYPLPAGGKTEWEYSSPGVSCVRACASGYVTNGNMTECVPESSTSPCGDRSKYGKSPWMHKDELCVNGWTLDTSPNNEPNINWTLDGNACKPKFAWYCKKGTTQKECTEDLLNVAYVKTNIPYNEGIVSVDDNLYGDANANSVLGSAGGIEVILNYFNTIYDGIYTGQLMCQLPMYDIKNKPLPVYVDELDIWDVGTIGWKVESFRYEPSIYTIGSDSYVLTPVVNGPWYQPYICDNVNPGAVLKAFTCVHTIRPELK